jgi:hypothetical protein
MTFLALSSSGMNAFDYIREIGERVSRITHKRMVSQEVLIYNDGVSILGIEYSGHNAW